MPEAIETAIMIDTPDTDTRANDPGKSISPEDEPAINAPKVVIWLGILLVVIHTVRQFLPVGTDNWLTLAFSFIPARYADFIQQIPGGIGAYYWSFITHQLLHGDWSHLGLNVLFMVAFGSVLARRFGTPMFLAFSVLAR